MQTFSDFCVWIGSRQLAARALGISESSVSRIANGKQGVSKELAERCEALSCGKFRKELVLWPESIEKNKVA
jgi:DNA-binding transcriptional regulator YdaS (Cro superfamily)